MKRAIGLIGILLGLGTCVAGSWLALRPPLAPFLAPGARDIQVVTVSIWEQQINYRAAGPPFSWYWAMAQSLEEQQWTLRTPVRPDLGSNYNPIIALRFERISFGVLVDEVVVQPDQRNPSVARIRVSRRIAIPCLQLRVCS